MNIAVNSAAIAVALHKPLAEKALDRALCDLKDHISQLHARAHEHDDEIDELHEVIWNGLRQKELEGLDRALAWEQVKRTPAADEHDRLVTLTKPFHDEIERLIEQMWSIPASSSKGAAAKVWVLLHCVMGLDWLETDDHSDWDVCLCRQLLIELVGGTDGKRLRQQFADIRVANQQATSTAVTQADGFRE